MISPWKVPEFNLFGDPDELRERLGELADQMQGAQKVAWADNAIKLAVDMTVAAINRLDLSGSSDEQAVAGARCDPHRLPRVGDARARGPRGPFRSTRRATRRDGSHSFECVRHARGTASVEALATSLLVAALLAGASSPSSPPRRLPRPRARWARRSPGACAARPAEPGPCWRDPLTVAYGRSLAGAVRALAPAPFAAVAARRPSRRARWTSATAATRPAPCRARARADDVQPPHDRLYVGDRPRPSRVAASSSTTGSTGRGSAGRG